MISLPQSLHVSPITNVQLVSPYESSFRTYKSLYPKPYDQVPP